MNLSFTRIFPSRKKVLAGKETKFVEKIFQSLNHFNLTKFNDYSIFCDRCMDRGLIDFDYLEHVFGDDDKGKIHTIRKDESGRWQEGTPIHFLIDTNTKEQFQFAPVVRCTGIERIKIKYIPSLFQPLIQVGEFLLNTKEIKELAKNDGFDSVDDFFGWFDKDFEGWIIHWTPVRYEYISELKGIEPIESIEDIEVNDVEMFGKDGSITKALNGNCSNEMTAPKMDCVDALAYAIKSKHAESSQNLNIKKENGSDI